MITPEYVFKLHVDGDCPLCLDGPPVCDAFKLACWAEEVLTEKSALISDLVEQRDALLPGSDPQ